MSVSPIGTYISGASANTKAQIRRSGGTWGRESKPYGQFIGPQKMQKQIRMPCLRDAIYTRTQIIIKCAIGFDLR